jgi:hypothetical protein
MWKEHNGKFVHPKTCGVKRNTGREVTKHHVAFLHAVTFPKGRLGNL